MTTILEILSVAWPAREQLLLAAADGLWIFIAIMVISAISNWLKQRNQPQTDDPLTGEEGEPHPHSPPAHTPAPAAPKTVDWEEEMRRILGGEPAYPTPPPPAIIVQAPPPMPPPAHAQPPFVPELRRSEEDSFDQQEDVHPHLSKLQEASQAFLRGQSLPEKVQERLHQVDLRTEHARPDAVRSHRSVRSSEGSAAIAMLRRPATTRQAMVASFILGPPKALE